MWNYQLDLTIHFGNIGSIGGKPAPYVVRLTCDPLLELIKDAKKAHRIYELLLIERPGDVWDYVQVEVSGNTETGSSANTGRKQAFNEYDSQFFWQWDDTPSIDAAWLTYRESPALQAYARQLLAMVRESIQKLGHGGHLITHVVDSIHGQTHALCFYTREKAIQKGLQYGMPDGGFTVDFHRQLGRLLRDKNLVSVAYRDGGDYEVLRALATEQRRRSNRTGHRLSQSLLIHALVNRKVGNEIWGSEIAYFDEGLGHGDLFIQGSGMGGSPVGALIQSGFRNEPAHILAATDQGEILGYVRTSGPGWFGYSRIEPVYRRMAMELAEHRRSSKLGFILAFEEVGATVFEQDMTVFYVGKSIDSQARKAIADCVAEWQGVGGKVILIVEGDQSLFIERSCKEIYAPPDLAGDTTDDELEHWLWHVFRRALPWVDVIISLDAPDWANRALSQRASDTDSVWTPWVVAQPEPKYLKVDYLLSPKLDIVINEAHRRATGFRSQTL